MLGNSTKNIILGNIQLLDYCKEQQISIEKLKYCNIEKIGDVYFFVMPKKCESRSMEYDIDSQPDVVLTMDVSNKSFQFTNTEWTKKILD